jgi:hypothetical protein
MSRSLRSSELVIVDAIHCSFSPDRVPSTVTRAGKIRRDRNVVKAVEFRTIDNAIFWKTLTSLLNRGSDIRCKPGIVYKILRRRSREAKKILSVFADHDEETIFRFDAALEFSVVENRPNLK